MWRLMTVQLPSAGKDGASMAHSEQVNWHPANLLFAIHAPATLNPTNPIRLRPQTHASFCRLSCLLPFLHPFLSYFSMFRSIPFSLSILFLHMFLHLFLPIRFLLCRNLRFLSLYQPSLYLLLLLYSGTHWHSAPNLHTCCTRAARPGATYTLTACVLRPCTSGNTFLRRRRGSLWARGPSGTLSFEGVEARSGLGGLKILRIPDPRPKYPTTALGKFIINNKPVKKHIFLFVIVNFGSYTRACTTNRAARPRRSDVSNGRLLLQHHPKAGLVFGVWRCRLDCALVIVC